MMRMTEAQWDAVIAVNLKSAFQLYPCLYTNHDAPEEAAVSSIWHL
jgi:NAD(P)-dependent dehydrogenase (short-subunit alcohol dehydrogenase family)